MYSAELALSPSAPWLISHPRKVSLPAAGYLQVLLFASARGLWCHRGETYYEGSMGVTRTFGTIQA